mmetsp:Transcript_13457/g.38441  ORF Transcript_13457/g.38441 Transcript_13457/m.38441 type:complete len:257 (+) Transcript_13457:2461-3231(+)
MDALSFFGIGCSGRSSIHDNRFGRSRRSSGGDINRFDCVVTVATSCIACAIISPPSLEHIHQGRVYQPMLLHSGLGLGDSIVKGEDVPVFSVIPHSLTSIGATILLCVIFISIVTRSNYSNGPIQVRMELGQAVVRFDDLIAEQLGLVATGILDHGPVRPDGPNVALVLLILLLLLLFLLRSLLALLALLWRRGRGRRLLDEQDQFSAVGCQPPIQWAQPITVVIGVVLSQQQQQLLLAIVISNGTMRRQCRFRCR